jgi:hypothetical protein
VENIGNYTVKNFRDLFSEEQQQLRYLKLPSSLEKQATAFNDCYTSKKKIHHLRGKGLSISATSYNSNGGSGGGGSNSNNLYSIKFHPLLLTLQRSPIYTAHQ